jgi:hypothetical protein
VKKKYFKQIDHDLNANASGAEVRKKRLTLSTCQRGGQAIPPADVAGV